MDLWTFNKLAAAALLSLLVLVGANTAIPILYPQGGPGEYQVVQVEPETQTAEADTEEEQAPKVEPLPVLLAAADPSAGEKVGRQCTACHVFEEGGPNRVGPNLYSVVGREVAAVEGFAYSNALQEYGGEWSYERLDCFLENPSECVPGTSMGYAGIKDAQDRADMIAYLASLGEAPPFPEPEAAGETAEATAETPPETEDSAQQEAPSAARDEAASAEDQQQAAQQDETAETADAPTDGATEMADAQALSGDTMDDTPAQTDAAADGDSKLAAMFANADQAAGEQAVQACAACHSFNEGGPTKVGPNLYGIMGEDIAAADGFNYSNSLKGLDGTWTYERMNAWLENPMDYVPGTTMAYPGVKDDATRADIIAYLASLGDAPPLPGSEATAGEGGDRADAGAAVPATEAASLDDDAAAN